MIGKIMLGLVVFSILPLWRGSLHTRHEGMNLWQYLHEGIKTIEEGKFGHPHILYEEARQRARQAFVERFQIPS